MWIIAFSFFFFFPEILSIFHHLTNDEKTQKPTEKNVHEPTSTTKSIIQMMDFCNISKCPKILLDTLRTKNNYKYAIHFSNTFSLNVPLCTIAFLFEGGKVLINPAQWIIHCSITKVSYTITLYMAKCLRLFYRRKTSTV